MRMVTATASSSGRICMIWPARTWVCPELSWTSIARCRWRQTVTVNVPPWADFAQKPAPLGLWPTLPNQPRVGRNSFSTSRQFPLQVPACALQREVPASTRGLSPTRPSNRRGNRYGQAAAARSDAILVATHAATTKSLRGCHPPFVFKVSATRPYGPCQ